jgi:phage gp29-like protein
MKISELLNPEMGGYGNDPDFYAALQILPNPDVILRRLGRSEEVFRSIYSDAHVLGELRSIRSGLLSYEWRLQAASSRRADKSALELCQRYLLRPPSQYNNWSDLIWQIGQAVFYGFRVHEVVWQKEPDGFLLPIKINSVPNRRVLFSLEGEPRLRTRANPLEGEELPPYRFLLTRHMADYENPYGVALFSACFWPYTFKHSGFKYFVKFCEKFGIPWPVGKYPPGTPIDEQRKLLDGLESMVENAAAVMPMDSEIELLNADNGKAEVHTGLINLCNREMSKALTSQTLATEIVGVGARAAAETHLSREQAVNESDREMISDTLNQLFAWITQINIPNAEPPRHEFYEESEARLDWTEVFEKARKYVRIPEEFAHDRLQIPMAKEGDAVLPSATTPQFSQFAKKVVKNNSDKKEEVVSQYSEQLRKKLRPELDHWLSQIRGVVMTAPSLAAAKKDLMNLYPKLDKTQFAATMQKARLAGHLAGRYELLQEFDEK